MLKFVSIVLFWRVTIPENSLDKTLSSAPKNEVEVEKFFVTRLLLISKEGVKIQ